MPIFHTHFQNKRPPKLSQFLCILSQKDKTHAGTEAHEKLPNDVRGGMEKKVQAKKAIQDIKKFGMEEILLNK